MVYLKKFHVRKMVKDAENELADRRQVLKADKEVIERIKIKPSSNKNEEYQTAFSQYEEEKSKFYKQDSEHQDLLDRKDALNRTIDECHFEGKKTQDRIRLLQR